MSPVKNGSLKSPALRESEGSADDPNDEAPVPSRMGSTSIELQRSLAEIKGQAQFVLYLADQIEESLDQLVSESDPCHGAFLCKVLGMYSGQLESKHQGLGEKIAETCQEVYVTVREREMS
jgi:hypothetical protein